MARKIKLVTDRKDDSGAKVFDFRCPHTSGCGGFDSEGAHVPFHSTGWNDRDHAVERGKQHLAEHDGGDPMPSLHEFRQAKGITPRQAGQASDPDDWEF